MKWIQNSTHLKRIIFFFLLFVKNIRKLEINLRDDVLPITSPSLITLTKKIPVNYSEKDKKPFWVFYDHIKDEYYYCYHQGQIINIPAIGGNSTCKQEDFANWRKKKIALNQTFNFLNSLFL